MKNVKELLSGLSYNVIAGRDDVPVSSIAFDSRKVTSGSLFVCIRGFVSDGHKFILQAVKQGVAAIMIQNDQNDFSESELLEMTKNHQVTIVSTSNTRIGLAHASNAFFSHPSRSLRLIGITGTKGKTTTSYMIREIFEMDGKSTGLIGTVSNIIAGDIRQAARTTPESYDLQAILHEMVEKKQDSCIMEVSSQGLMLDRVYGCHFRAGAFTNLYHDHIGLHEHADMEEYLQAKLLIFDMSDIGIVNADCSVAKKVLAYANNKGPVITYGIDAPCDVRAFDIRKDRRNGMIGTSFSLRSPWYNASFFIGMPGKFNIYNALCAISVAGTCGVSEEAVRNGLESVRVPGRLQIVPHTGKCTVLVDYAHNAASLENVLVTLREYCPGRLITLFGCGGDRAKSRRFEMGEVSGRLSDMTIITSDNPRSEDPMAIIADILTGFSKTDGAYQIEPDRTNAIALAISIAKEDDFVIIAGKGHENYQIFKDHTIHYDNAEIAEKLLVHHAAKTDTKEKQ